MKNVIYRPHRGSLDDAMLEIRTFESIDEMKQWICDDHNKKVGHIWTLTPEEIDLQDYGNDDRICWNNQFLVTPVKPSKIKNLKGYLWYFGLDKNDSCVIDDFECGVLGMCSTDWDATFYIITKDGEVIYEG